MILLRQVEPTQLIHSWAIHCRYGQFRAWCLQVIRSLWKITWPTIVV